MFFLTKKNYEIKIHNIDSLIFVVSDTETVVEPSFFTWVAALVESSSPRNLTYSNLPPKKTAVAIMTSTTNRSKHRNTDKQKTYINTNSERQHTDINKQIHTERTHKITNERTGETKSRQKDIHTEIHKHIANKPK